MKNVASTLMRKGLSHLHNSAVQVFAIRMIGAAVAYVSQLIIARWLSPTDNGIYIQYMSILAIIIPFFTLGFETSPQFFVNYYKEKKQYAHMMGFIETSKLISVIMTVLFMSMSYLIGIYLNVQNDTLYAVLVIGAIGMPWALIEIQGGIARCWNWMWLAIAPSFLFRFLVLALVCLMYAILSDGSRFIDALELTFIATTCVCVAQFFFLKKALKSAIPCIKDREYQTSSWVQYGVPVALSNVLYIALMFSDVLIIGQLFTSQDVAVYYIASKTIIISNFIVYAIGVSASQKFSQHYANGNFIELQNEMRKATQNSLIFTLLTSVFLISFGYWILYLFGEVYLSGYPYIVILSIIPIVRALIGPADRLMLMAKAEAIMAKNVFKILCVTILCQTIGAFTFEIAGVAFGSIIASIIEVTIIRNSAKKVLNIECFIFLQKNIIKYSPIQNIKKVSNYNNIFFNKNYLKLFSENLKIIKYNPILISVNNKENHSIGEIPVTTHTLLGLNLLSNATHKNAVLGTPAIRYGLEQQFCDDFLKQLKTRLKCDIFTANYINNNSFIAALFTQITFENFQILHKINYSRAILDLTTAQSGKEYIQNSISSGRLKEYRRLYRRLQEKGNVKTVVHTLDTSIRLAFARYLQLEASGWKGKTRKSSEKEQQDIKCFEAFIEALIKDQKIQIIEITLNETTIASSIIIVNDDVAYYYKTSYDETYAKYSIGVLLTLELTHYMFTIPNLKYVDSCAVENHSMINHIWRQRQELLDIIITPHVPMTLKWIAAKLYVYCFVNGRAILKNLYLTLNKVYKN